jgi:CubicO group peptidase (beta-lactamase class C family)
MEQRFRLDETVREARGRTGVPGVAAGLARGGETVFAADGVLTLGGSERVTVETPFRIASVSKPFTATLAARTTQLDAGLRSLLSHTAGLRCESDEELPESCRGLWSYSNAGYWAAGERVAAACGTLFSDAMRAHVLEPLGLAATGFEEPEGAACGHLPEGESGYRPAPPDAYPVERRPSGGLWSTVGDLIRFGRHQLRDCGELHPPEAEALGAGYALGWWVRDLGGRTALDHEGSVGGYQSLLLLVPELELVLAVLTNSWRGSGLVRRVVEALELATPAPRETHFPPDEIAGTYALDGVEATVSVAEGGLRVVEAEVDPVTGARIERRYPARPLGGGVYGFARGVLQSNRLDFPRPDVARVGWLALPRTGDG